MPISDTFLDSLQDTELLIQKKNEITPIMKYVKKFFKTKEIVLYGGTAINMYLDKKEKFYTDFDIPDYDGFHYDAEKNSVSLLKKLKKMQYDFLIVRYAIHDGTYKISWAFKDIADISQMNKHEYNRILKTSEVIDGMYVCNINLLKANAYIELAMPKSSLFRWSKVYKRLQLLETKYKHTSKFKVQSMLKITLSSELQDIVETLKKVCVKKRIPIVGFEAIKYYLNIKSKKANTTFYNEDFPLLEVISSNMYETSNLFEKMIVTNIKKSNNKNRISYNFVYNQDSQIVPETIDCVLYDGKKTHRLYRIHDASNRCISYEIPKDSKTLYGSIFFLLYYYYYLVFKNDNKEKLDIYKAVIVELLKKIDESNFTIQCHGFNKSVSAIKKSRYLKKKPGVLVSS
tara:strand:- start:1364 stop:2566 length:1203 start_codon:yes stop_codon:yes gene_type:complete